MIITRKQLSLRDHHCFAAPLLIAFDAKKHPVIDGGFAGLSTQGDDVVHGEMSTAAGITLHICSPVTHSRQANFSPNARAPVSDQQSKHAIYAAIFLGFSILLLYSIFLDFQDSSAAVNSPTDRIVALTDTVVVKIEF